MNFRNDIQGLRGIAILLVLFYHLYPRIVSGGFIGVDIFFVISGFLVCYSIERRIGEKENRFYFTFYAARIRRLFPASYVTILLISCYIYRYDFTYFSVFKNDAIASLFIVANYKFYFQKIDYFHVGLKESPLLHYWSLSLEEQFYIIAPIIIWIGYNNIMMIYMLILLLSLFICIKYGYNDKNKGYFFLSSRSWEFVFGALNKHSLKIVEKNSIILYNGNIGIILIIFVSIYCNDKINYPSYNAIIPVFLSLYILNSSNQFTLTSSGSICLIGDLSYSIYLIHFPLKNIISNSTKYYSILTCTAILLHNIVEKPFYRGFFIFSTIFTYILTSVLLLFLINKIITLDKKVMIKLKKIKHYSSSELMDIFAKNGRSFCCFKENLILHNSAILFIGDSHIEQYIIGLFNSEYKHKYQLLHIYINTMKYCAIAIKNYMSNIITKYHFELCILGNHLRGIELYDDIIDMSIKILPMCNKVLISNDNPYHLVDPNSCVKDNKDECYGEINKTCILPKPFAKPNNKKIEIVTLWDKNIIKHNKCLYYYNYYPVYSDTNHFSIFQLKLNVKRIVEKISLYIEDDKNFKYNNICPYYHISNSYYPYCNLNKEKC